MQAKRGAVRGHSINTWIQEIGTMKRQVAALVHLLPKLHRNPMEERNERAQQITQALAWMNPMTRQDNEIILAQNTYDFYGGKYYITVQSLPWMHACTNERALPLNERYTILDKLPYKSNGNRDCLPFTKTLGVCNTGKRMRLEYSMLLLLCLGHAFLTPIEIVCTFIQRWSSVTQLQQAVGDVWWGSSVRCCCCYVSDMHFWRP